MEKLDDLYGSAVRYNSPDAEVWLAHFRRRALNILETVKAGDSHEMLWDLISDLASAEFEGSRSAEILNEILEVVAASGVDGDGYVRVTREEFQELVAAGYR
jgi:hypothetical protein